MERKRVIRKADLILCSDFHLREDTPTCWIGDFQEEQWESVIEVSNLQSIHNCLVLHTGDLFHHWKPSPWLLSQAIRYLPKQFHTIYGQHDLPQHNWELRNKSGISTLEQAGAVKVLEGSHYGQDPEKLRIGYTVYWQDEDTFYPLNLIRPKILGWHHLTYQAKPFPDAVGGIARGILRKYPQFDLIVTGDNHQSFSEEYQGRLLVNPGNLTRQTADQMDFKPRVALWYAETNTIEWVEIPIKQGVITREHIQGKEEREERLSAFISQLDNDWSTTMSFEDNLEAFKEKNQISEVIMSIIYKALEHGNIS